MRIALVHDYLNQYGGAERVLEHLIEFFPGAPIYTTLYDEAATANRFSAATVRTSFLDFPLARRHHRWFIPLLPRAVRHLNLEDDYDLIISAGAGYAKGVSYGTSTRHIYYCYSPLRYAWEEDYLRTVQFPVFDFPVLRYPLQPVLAYLRRWDYQTAQRPERILAVSGYVAEKIKRYYGRDAAVLYPPVDTRKFFYEPRPHHQDGGYYLVAGRLIEYKNISLVIEAFNRLERPLKIVGGGRDFSRLARFIRSPRIELISFVPDDETLRRLYAGARGFVFAGVEDFGLVMAEAQACGTPVVALAAGGAREIVEEGKTGVFFPRPTIEDLTAGLRRFEEMSFDRAYISQSMRRFSPEQFGRALQSHLAL